MATSLRSGFPPPELALAPFRAGSCWLRPLLLFSSHKDRRSGRDAGREWLPHLKILSLHPHRAQSPPPAPRDWDCAQGLGKPWGRCAGKSQSTQPPSFAAPLTHVCVHSAPPHTRVHHSARATACPAPQPPQPSVCPSVPCQLPQNTPPSRLPQSVSAVSPLINLERCHGDAAMGRSGCGAAEGPRPTAGQGGAGWIHAWDCTHVTSQVCSCTGVGFPGCVVAHVCARCRRRVCTRVRVCTHARTDVCSACAGLWGLGDPTLGQWGPRHCLVPPAAVPGGKPRQWRHGIHPARDGHLGTGGPRTATTSDPSRVVLGPASTITPWLRSHTCGALRAGDPTHTRQQPARWDGGAATWCVSSCTRVFCACVCMVLRGGLGNPALFGGSGTPLGGLQEVWCVGGALMHEGSAG